MNFFDTKCICVQDVKIGYPEMLVPLLPFANQEFLVDACHVVFYVAQSPMGGYFPRHVTLSVFGIPRQPPTSDFEAENRDLGSFQAEKPLGFNRKILKRFNDSWSSREHLAFKQALTWQSWWRLIYKIFYHGSIGYTYLISEYFLFVFLKICEAHLSSCIIIVTELGRSIAKYSPEISSSDLYPIGFVAVEECSHRDEISSAAGSTSFFGIVVAIQHL